MNPSQNNSFGSFRNNGGDFGGAGQSIISSGDSSGAGLAMSRKRDGKKWLIVAGVVLVLLAVGLLVGMAMRRGESRSGSGLEATFNRFANYVLFEKNTTDLISGEYSEDTTYAIDTVLGSFRTDKNTMLSFSRESSLLWQDFYDDFFKTDYTKSEYMLLNSRVDYLNEMMAFLPIYYSTPIMGELELVESYSRNGDNATQDLIKSTYENLLGSNNLFVREYGEMISEIVAIRYEKAKNIVTAGCYKEMSLDDVCVSNIEWPAEVNESVARRLALENEVEGFVVGKLPEIERSIFVINSQLSDPTIGISEEENDE